MNKFWKIFDSLMEDLLFITVAGCTIICFLQVIFRYVLNNSLSWSEELCRYLFVGMVFIGTGVGILQKKHMAIDLFINKFPKQILKFINLSINIIMGIYGCVFIWYSYKLASLNMGQYSPALKIPLGIVYLFMTFGGVLIVINSVRIGIIEFKEESKIC